LFEAVSAATGAKRFDSRVAVAGISLKAGVLAEQIPEQVRGEVFAAVPVERAN
jgi:hypothetical protein